MNKSLKKAGRKRKVRKPTKALQKRFKHVLCPVCGSVPFMSAVWDDGKYAINNYKMHCPKWHVDCGNYKHTRLEAMQEWLKRIKDTSQPDFCYESNARKIARFSTDELAEFLFKWIYRPGEMMCKDHKDDCSHGCKHGYKCFAINVTEKIIKEWLQAPASGKYPKGYPMKGRNAQ